jgi:hypothetical protein
VDGSHIFLSYAPTGNPDRVIHINRKQRFSVQLQAVVDAQGMIMDLLIGAPGSVHDARVFELSPLNQHLHSTVPPLHFILGDAAYALLPHVHPRYKRVRGHLTAMQMVANRALSSGRVGVEMLFGALKGRFRCLFSLYYRSSMDLKEVVLTCGVLHNWCKMKSDEVDDQWVTDWIQTVNTQHTGNNMSAAQLAQLTAGQKDIMDRIREEALKTGLSLAVAQQRQPQPLTLQTTRIHLPFAIHRDLKRWYEDRRSLTKHRLKVVSKKVKECAVFAAFDVDGEEGD